MRIATRRRETPVHDAFPLRTVAARTGLTTDLIRAWEKRYGVVAPIRSARGARLYSSADIAHLRLLAHVVDAGRAIGDVAALSRAALEQLAGQRTLDGRPPESAKTTSPREELITRVIERLASFDEASVMHLLGDAVVAVGQQVDQQFYGQDNDDELHGSQSSGAQSTDTLDGGTGNDHIFSKNQMGSDAVKCDLGNDSAQTDLSDTVSGCETVTPDLPVARPGVPRA